MPIEIFDKFTVPTFRIDTINNAIKSVLGFVNVGRFSNNSQAIFVYLPVAIVNYVLMFYKSNIYAWLFVFLSCAKSILFEYQSRDADNKFKNTTYEVDRPISLNSLLTKIILNADGQRFKSYTLKYANNNINVFLNEIIETGSDDMSNLNSTIFKYGDQPNAIFDVNVGFSNSNGNDLISGDFNGDGYTDIATANRYFDNGKVYHSSFTVYTKQPLNNNLFNFKYTKVLPYLGEIDEKKSSYNVLSSDFNGDGKDDIAYLLTDKYQCDGRWTISDVYFKEMKIYLNNGDASSTSDLTITLPAPYTSNHNGVYNLNKYFNVGDYNGDGIMDVFLIMVKRVNCLLINPDDLSTKGFIWYGNSGSSNFTEINITC